MPEGLSPISSSRVSTGDIARHSFAIVRRGFDADEVRSYLQSVSRAIEGLEEREQELRNALAEAEQRAAHPVVDEATLTSSLGQHSAQLLRHAHEEAARIVAQAQESAAALLREAQSQGEGLQTRTEEASAERVVEVERMVANAEQEARTERDRVVATAMHEGEAIVNQAKDEGRALLEQVQESRRRVLADLATRRKTLSIQIEQLRAARDEMAASVGGVRDKVDDILVGLERVDDDARAAALAAGDQARVHGTVDDVPDEVPPLGETSGEESAAGPTPTVDELFARIRAGTDETGEATVTESVRVIETTAAEPAPGAPTEAPAEPTAESEAEVEEEAAPDPPPDPLTARRDELLEPVLAQLSRHVKRALGDDQNRVLDLLRNAPSTQAEALLGSEEAHLAVYTSAAQGHLADAFTAGARFAGSPDGAVVVGNSVDQTATGLARTVVTMLRRRIVEGSDDLAERVGGAFREWRGERIERLVGDFAVHAFSAGTAAASSPGGKVRWVLTSATGCSDCDDNALAGAMPSSEAFPTGHQYPPAHSGCRCLLAPE
ncbi:MAG TPA: DivIVA domain-containing protein [Acidimicrobiales bacterium]|jgi:DivIVA domain-containing protein